MENKKNIGSIDFEIIWKSFHAQLTEDEEQKLMEWLHENREHEVYYEKAKAHYSKRKTDIASVSLNDLRKKIEPSNYIGRKRNKHRRLWVTSVAASILLIALSFLLFQYMDKKPLHETPIAKESVKPSPGGKKAILHIDGEKILLGESSTADQLSKQRKKSFLKISKKSLTYGTPTDDVIVQHVLETPRGGEFMLTLGDGTKVWINAASKLTYPSSFSKNERLVKLKGEAYFEVAHDRERPFKVLSGKQTIEVLGTSFNLSNYPKEATTSTLVEGQIQIDTKAGASATLMAGEQAIYNEEDGLLDKRKVNTSHFTAWREGLFYFKDESLQQIMTVLARWYSIDDLQYKNVGKKEIRFTGTLKRYDSFQEVTDIIEMTGDVKFKTVGNKVIIE